MHLTANRRTPEDEPGAEVCSVLVLRFSSMGDIILTTPVLRALRARWPQARITFVTKQRFADLVTGNPVLDEIETLDEPGGSAELEALRQRLSGRRWDLLVDLHNSLRSRMLRRRVDARIKTVYRKPLLRRSLLIYGRLDRFGPAPVPVPERYAAALSGLGVRLDGLPCELYPAEADYALLDSKLPSHWRAEQPYLTLAPGAAWPVKRWPAERFGEAAAALAASHGLRVLLLGGAAERELCAQVCQELGLARAVNLAGALPLLASAAALAGARVLLANDTGLMHAATAVGTPVVAVFGPTTHHFGYFPYHAAARVVETPLWCRPCTHNGRARCPLGHFRCMRGIPAQRVVAAAEELLGGGV